MKERSDLIMKKIFSKVKQFFGLDEELEHNEYETNDQQEESSPQPREQVKKPGTIGNQQSEQQLQQQDQVKAFRFPLIDVDDRAVTQLENKKSVVFQDPREDDSLKLPKHLPGTSKVLDVEVSGIRELLEKRNRSGHSTSNVVRLNNAPTARKSRNVSREEAVFLTDKPARQDIQQPKENPAFVNPMENKKRFTPTNVPSPVHGFQQPRPIRELLKEEHNIDLNIPVVFNAEEVVPAEVHTNIDTANEVAATTQQIISEEVDKSESTTKHTQAEKLVESVQQKDIEPLQIAKEQLLVEEVAETIQAEEPQVLIEQVEKTEDVKQENVKIEGDAQRINELQLQNVTFENSTVHIGQIHVEPSPVTEKVIVQEKQVIVEQKATISEEIKQEKTNPGSKLPFNVIMLKSDKEKLKNNLFEQIKAGVPHTIVDKVELRRDAQNGLKQAGIEPLENEHDGDLATKSQVEEVLTVTETTPQEQTQPINQQHALEHHEALSPIQVLVEQQQPVDEQVEQKQQPQIEEQLVVDKTLQLSEQYEESRKVVIDEQPILQNEELALSIVARDELEDEPSKEQLQLDDMERRLLSNFQAANELSGEQGTQQAAVAVLEKTDVPTQVQQLVNLAEQDRLQQQVSEEPVAEVLSISKVDETPMQQKFTQTIPVVEPVELVATLNENETSLILPIEVEPIVEVKPYEKPPLQFLAPPEGKTEDTEWMEEQAAYLLEALSSHQITAQVESIVQGPAVTQFEITVAAGTKVSKVRNLSDDIKLALAARDIRIDAPIPGKRTIGIEIPNRIARAVRLSEVTDSEAFQESDSPLEAALGLDLNGKPVTLDLRKMPHGLIAGATGSGKSVCINSILVSLLYKADPHELKLMLIDPKMVELAPFNHIPHLVSPVITDVKAATAALKWAVEEMERRYALFMHAGVRDITRFNSQAEKAGQHAQKMPYILIVIDELADLMMMSPADVEEAICRIAQKARACGIHLIVATQRPSVDVITGLIKSNIPTRIAFAVSSAIDSRTILDGQGAERLLGRGDMLYLGNGMPAPIRLQGTFVTDDEIEEIIDYVRAQGEPNYIFEHEELLKKAEFVEEQDELFEEVCRYVFEAGSASTSSIQRRYHLGYNRAARLVDMLERHGFVSEQRGSKPREVFITEADLENLFS